MTESTLLLALDLTGTFAFGLNGALTAVRAARLDVVGVVAIQTGIYGLPAALGAAAVCFVIRMLGVQFGLQAPRPPRTGRDSDVSGSSESPSTTDDQ